MFVLLIHYFEFRLVVGVYLLMAIFYLAFKVKKRSSFVDMAVPGVIVLILSIAYYYSSIQSVKYIPATLSAIFSLLFIDAHFNKKYMVLGFTKRFYRKDLSEAEIDFLKKGDGYWVFVMLVNTIIHIYIVNFCSNIVWAFYSSVGWYILFFGALLGQIIYGKVYGVKVHTR